MREKRLGEKTRGGEGNSTRGTTRSEKIRKRTEEGNVNGRGVQREGRESNPGKISNKNNL